MPYGYNGRILRVDLTNEQISVEEPGEAFYRTYMGGAMALDYILREMPAHADPLGPENVLVVSTGVMTGAPIAGQSRVMASAKSPLTGGIGAGEGGGFWPAEFKFAGFDAVVITGAAEKPVYLWVHDGEAEIRDASQLWGKVTGEAEAAIREELGDPKIEVLQIGPAGENQVSFAAIMNMSNRAIGRSGMGAVMGSKKLKAIAVRGQDHPEIFDPDALRELANWGREHRDDLGTLTALGTAHNVMGLNESGGLPTRNWSSGVFEGYQGISGELMAETVLQRNGTCQGCWIRCKRVVEIEGEVDPVYGGPEYETIAMVGSSCGVDDLETVCRANQICNAYGLDTMSAGATVAFAMDCFENGVLNDADTGGLDLRFGNGQAMCTLLEQIALRQGLGDLLAEGSDRAAERLGEDAKQYSVAVKNYALPAHMPELKRSLALLYAVNPFGPDHNAGEHDPSYLVGGSDSALSREAALGLYDPEEDLESLDLEKVRFTLYNQYKFGALDSVGICSFVWGSAWGLYSPGQLVAAMRAVTGWDVSLWELMKLGERRLNMMRAFNAREGLDRKDDWLPDKCFQPKVGGPSDGLFVDPEELRTAIDQYYAMAGWDDDGVPTRGKLMELGLDWVAELL